MGRQYVKRQAAMLLNFAKLTNNRDLAAILVNKAADLKSQLDDESSLPDPAPLVPDVDPPPAA
jgi:hypothetical protein